MGVKELNLEQLKEVAGGAGERMLYYLNLFVQTVNAKYNAWLPIAASCSNEERYLKVQEFIQEAYDSLDADGKRYIDDFKASYPVLWENIVKSIAN